MSRCAADASAAMSGMGLPAPSKSGILPGTKCPPAPPAERMWRLAGSNADGMACPLAGITDMPAHKAARRFGAHAVAVSGILAHAPRGHNEPAGHTIRQRKCRNCRAKTSGRAIFGPHSTCGSGPPAHGPTAAPRPVDARAWFALGAQCRAPAWAPEARQAVARQEF